MASSAASCLSGGERRQYWWLTNRKVVDKYIRDARNLIATREQSEITSALSLLDAALELSPRLEQALELKARSLLHLRRFRDIADMLQDYIPSLKMGSDDSSSSSSDGSSQQQSREQATLLPGRDSPGSREPSLRCFSISDLKKKVMAGLTRSCDKEGQWRYLVLGQACCHLGLMEDAVALLQTWKRLNSAAFRRESIHLSEDSFSLSNAQFSTDVTASLVPSSPPKGPSECESINHLLGHIKFLLRRQAAALAALDAGLYSESIRHFSKIIDGRYGAPQWFLAQCYMLRATAFKSAGRVVESIADCNRTLALNPTSIQALKTRAVLLESIRCLPDCLHDLEHLRLLYNTILRDRKLPVPAWKQQNVHYKEIPRKLGALTSKVQELKQRMATGDTGHIDYYALIGLRRGCSRSELERAYRLLSLKHKPNRALDFLDKCEFEQGYDFDSIKDRAKMSGLLLYRLLQKAYASIASIIMDEEEVDKQRKKAAAALQAEQAAVQVPKTHEPKPKAESSLPIAPKRSESSAPKQISLTSNAKKVCPDPSVHRGVFCRDMAAVGSLLAQVGYNRPLPVKYAALSC
ncbi:hypothetical protein CDL15_Pgr010046 [Punica granatum]|uniref:J domain-containing protein n=1 Tax=Punica granatum TaxID=22663 RepID=A0A218X5J4_PUNGR|nr:hypothetical protein CDL15_Pgr010046 [Punica granatum]PKI70285.1 hypothetical protein CRG98_009314 [Punica granatum]